MYVHCDCGACETPEQLAACWEQMLASVDLGAIWRQDRINEIRNSIWEKP